MIRFVADGKRGRVLGLGLSFDNLRLLADSRPIVFDLAPLGSRGTFVLACGPVDEVVRFVERSGLADARIVRVDEARLASFRRGEALSLDLEALGVPGFTDAILFAGPTEFEVVEALRSAGLVKPETELEGIEEYRRHQAGLVQDCPLCQARKHGLPDDLGLSWLEQFSQNSPPPPTPAQASRSTPVDWRALLRSPLFRLFLVTAVVGSIVGILVAPSVRHKRSASHDERESPARARARERIVSAEKPRSAFFDTARRNDLAPALSADSCPVAVQLPHALGSLERQMVHFASSKPDRALGESLRMFALYGPGFDLLPPASAGADGGERVGATPEGTLPQAWPTLVVEQWTDAEFEAGAAEAVTAERRARGLREPGEVSAPLEPVTTGSVRGRLLLWGYAEERLICASPPVEARTPSVFLTPGADLATVAKLETVLAAFAAAVPELKAIEAGSPPDAESAQP